MSLPPADESRQRAARVPPGQPSEPQSDTPAFEELAEHAVKQFGEFRILRPLGHGGMSEVYLAEQTSLHRQVAVKVLRQELLSDSTILKRFEQEAKAAAALMHANIVQVYAFGQQDGLYYIAQEYVQGMNLRQLLNRRGPPELLVAYHIMRQVAAALTVAAEAGIVHRDIKPENILITRKGEAKVADFGLAQLAQSEQRVNLTQVGMTMGTPLYMSPEQINGETVDHRSDIYSFGVTCYRMLSGHPPFRGDTTLGVAMQHLTRKPEDLSTLRKDLPPVISEIVHKMMARNPADRYQHARDITQDLKKVGRLIKDDPGAAGAVKLSQITVPSPALAPVRAPRAISRWSDGFFNWPVSRHAIALGIAALVFGSASGAVGWWLRPKDPLQTPALQQDRSPHEPTAQKQFARASQLRSDEDAWRAVLDYYPDDRVYTVQAKERLAVLYLRTLKLKEAGKLFNELESMGRENPKEHAIGIAGQAIIATLQKDYKKSQGFIYDLGDLTQRRTQLSSDLWQMLQHAGRINARELGQQENKQLQDLFEGEP
ncbi:MAG TPA: serine/threonine-protein kinase [Planctomycetaceae bacterium]|jgi:serine/threonine protein kinase|nr:serine/threonine-protein kinase [Planctomycetaceae bacterium]